MTRFCVRKAQEKQGRVYAMQYNGDSEGEEDSDEEEDESKENVQTALKQPARFGQRYR